MRRRHGFTLVELIIVIAVIGVLAAILIPTFSNVIEKANAKSALSDGRNTVTEYVTEFMDKEMRGESMPENIIVYVKKAGKYYLYSYNTKGDGQMAVSNGNPFKADDIESINAEWSWNAKQGDIPAPAENTEYTDAAQYGYFYLIPYTTDTHESAAPGYRGFFNTGASVDYRDLTDETEERMGSDVTTMHGFLLPGTFTYQNDNAGSGTSTPSTPSTPTERFTVNFAYGDLPEEFRALTSLPASTQVDRGTPVNSFTMGNAGTSDDDVYYTFEGWDATGVINADTTLTAQWQRHEAVSYTLKFEGAEGATMPNLPTDQTLRAGTDISDIINGAGVGATKEHATFTGWSCGGTTYPATGNTNVTLTSDMTFTAQFSDTVYTLTFKSGDGTGSDHTITGSFNEQKTLPTLAECGFTAPTGKGFTNWKFSGGTRAAGAEWTITEDVTFTAEYEELKFTVHYAKTGSETVPEDKTYAVGTASVTLEASTYAWHKFGGYGTTLGQSGLTATASIDTSAVAAGTTITVTPSWTKKTISISYAGDGLSNTAKATTVTLDPEAVGFTAEHTVIAQDDVKNYQKGKGFTVTAEPTAYTGISCDTEVSTYYPAGSKLTFAEPEATTVTITLTGCVGYYEINYAKGAEGATGTMNPATANETNQGVIAAADCGFTYEGYNFTGWKDLAADTSYAAGANVTLNGKDVTLTAQWEEAFSGESVYYFGGAYRDADLTLKWASVVPDGGTPCNILGELTTTTTLANGASVTRTFAATTNVTTTNDVRYVQVKETTDWSAVSGVTLVENTAGATVDGSIALSSLQGTSSSYINVSGVTLVLIEDVDWGSAAWTPIGGIAYNASKCFKGHFEGMGYAVNAVKINNNTTKVNGTSGNATAGIGFFARLNGATGTGNRATVNNFYLPGVDIEDGANYSSTGAIVGNAYLADVTNCHVSGHVNHKTGTPVYGTGGLVGYTQMSGSSQGNVSTSKCSFTGFVENYSSGTGGIVGKGIGSSQPISECWFVGTIICKSQNAGAIAGVVTSGTVSDCWAKAIVYTQSSQATSSSGGIVGASVGTGSAVSNCYFVGDIYTTCTNTTLFVSPICYTTTTSKYASCAFIIGSHQYKASLSGTYPNYTFSGTNVALKADGASSCSNGAGIIAVAQMKSWSTSIWDLSGTYPSLINNPGMPA